MLIEGAGKGRVVKHCAPHMGSLSNTMSDPKHGITLLCWHAHEYLHIQTLNPKL
jgi:hypothetical protein